MAYRWVATSVAGFIQQLAVGYVTKGYYFYVSGVIPMCKDVSKTDQKIMDAYGIEVSKWTRSRRRREGQANVQYLRWRNFYVLVAHHGAHPFFTSERKKLRDIRKRPVLFHGYAIGCRKGRDGALHASVRINRDVYRELNAHFEKIAVHRSVENLFHELNSLPFEPYAPIRQQLLGLLRRINRVRVQAGLERVPQAALRLRRSPVSPFEEPVKSLEKHHLKLE